MRKTTSFVLIMLLLIGIAGCDNKSPVESDLSSATSAVLGSETVPSTDTAATAEAQAELKKDEKQEETIKPTAPVPKEDSKHHDSLSGTDSTTNTDRKPTEDSSPATEPAKPETQTQTQPPQSNVGNATASDAEKIAEAVIKYINDYRTAQGCSSASELSGLSKYAKYRSRQIISDFSHNTLDERTAATALSYGMYVDPTLYGMSGEPYYTACAGEAIAKAGYIGTVDHVAKSLANLIRNSPEHWSYIGSAEYSYIGVGITYESGMWYCDVALTKENYG